MYTPRGGVGVGVEGHDGEGVPNVPWLGEEGGSSTVEWTLVLSGSEVEVRPGGSGGPVLSTVPVDRTLVRGEMGTCRDMGFGGFCGLGGVGWSPGSGGCVRYGEGDGSRGVSRSSEGDGVGRRPVTRAVGCSRFLGTCVDRGVWVHERKDGTGSYEK